MVLSHRHYRKQSGLQWTLPNLGLSKTVLTGQISVLLSVHCLDWCMHPGSWDPKQRLFQSDVWPTRSLLEHWRRNPDCSTQQQSQDEFQWLSGSMPVWRKWVMGVDGVKERGRDKSDYNMYWPYQKISSASNKWRTAHALFLRQAHSSNLLF